MPGFAIAGGGSRDLNLDPSPPALYSHRWKIDRLGPVRPQGTLYARTLQLPNLKFEETQVPGVSIDYKFAKKAVWEDVTVTFYDTAGTYEQLRQWLDKVYDQPAAQIQPADNYKDESVFVLLDGQGGDTIRYTLSNSYPKELSHGVLSYEVSDIKTITLLISYDFAEIDDPGAQNTSPGGFGGGAGPASTGGGR